MTCEQPLKHQLEIDLDSYEVFCKVMMGTSMAPGALLVRGCNPDGFNPSVRALHLWKKANGYLSAASWTKKLLLALTQGGNDGELGAKLLLAFANAFPGDEVGAPGRDIVEYALKHRVLELRAAAVVALESWLEDDDDGTWLDLLNDHVDFEPDRQLKSQCVELVQAWMAEELEEMLEDDDDDELDPPELEEYLEVGRQLPNRARAQLETSALPYFLEKLASAPRWLTLAGLESVHIGKLVAESNEHGFLLSRVGGGWQFHCWRLDGKSSFSIEPTAGDDNWLVFTRF